MSSALFGPMDQRRRARDSPARSGQEELSVRRIRRRRRARRRSLHAAKLNGLDPEAYLGEVIGRIADHPINRIAELLPWNLGLASPIAVAA